MSVLQAMIWIADNFVRNSEHNLKNEPFDDRTNDLNTRLVYKWLKHICQVSPDQLHWPTFPRREDVCIELAIMWGTSTTCRRSGTGSPSLSPAQKISGSSADSKRGMTRPKMCRPCSLWPHLSGLWRHQWDRQLTRQLMQRKRREIFSGFRPWIFSCLKWHFKRTSWENLYYCVVSKS